MRHVTLSAALLVLLAGPLAAQQPAPLTSEEKFHRYLKSTYGPVSLLRAGTIAGVDQWRDHPYEWGQGMEGYGRRIGSRFAHSSMKETIQFGVGALRGEDPRYFPSARQGFWPRAGYAIRHTFLVRTDDQATTFAIGRVTAAFGAGLLSRTWQPHRLASVSDGLESGVFTLGADVAVNVFREFWPDLKRRLGR